ncbi:HD family hydrolase [Sphingosinicella sp. BN140058]|uniref:HD domain-containing protein n=1 Tax=Sphingosinicella sp. BN140058 TaxID=1892855 RepID=UPI0010139D3B|nr:HD domain-containing protein [Sphingosinicella sp. BN140058]QAY75846.1 HD domain-containing protein [Sphingosinicella sp. BN140058]
MSSDQRPDPSLAQAIDPTRLESIVCFLQSAAALKDTLRSGRTASGRQESTADHSWRLGLLAMLLADDLDGINLVRLLQLCLVHDLAEAITGDVPAPCQGPADGRKARERAALRDLCAPLPEDLRHRVEALCEDYESCGSPESLIAKGLDKIETMLQHLIGANPAGFDYRFNLSYGRQITDRHPLLRQMRSDVDAQTRRRIADERADAGTSQTFSA